jgi:hypothetical protein
MTSYLFYPNWSDCIIGNIIRHKFVLWRFHIVIRFIKFITFVRCILYLLIWNILDTSCSMMISYYYWKSSWSWSYCSWIYNYLCNQCLSPLTLQVRISRSSEVYSIQHYVIKLSVSCDRSVVFLRALWFLPPIKLTATIYLKYCWKWR